MTIPHRAGVALSALVTLVLVLDAATQLLAPGTLAADMAATGWPLDLAPLLGAITLACAVLYAIPRTAVLGAIAITGFVGGAIATHLRLGEIASPPQLICVAIGLCAWAGLWLRTGEVRRLMPLAPIRA